MAEGSSSGDVGSGNWWDGWYQAAKEKSTAAFELVKKDLSEFTCTVRTDTGHAVAATSGTIQENMKGDRTAPAMTMVKSGISSILDGITRALTIPPDDGPVDEMVIQPSGEAMYNRGQARLSAIQLDPGTYCSPPSGPPEQYDMWRENFDLEAKKGEISEMLVSRVEVRALYTKLVPSEVSHADFWARYFYKVHQLQLDEARKVALMRRAEATRDDSISWDDEEESDGEVGGDFVKDLSPQKNFLSENKQHKTTTASDQLPKYSDQTASEKIILSEPSLVVNTDSSDGTDQLATDLSTTVKTNGQNSSNSSQNGSVLKDPDTDSPHSPVKNVQQATPITDKKETDSTSETCETSVDINSSKTDQEKSTGPQVNIPEEISQPSDVKVNTGLSASCDAAPAGQVQDSSAKPESKADSKVLTELKTREKGDMVVVGSGSSSPTSDASSSVKKETGSAEATDEDWDEDFDIELTEEDIRLAEEAAKKYKSPETLEDLDMMEEDWNWD